MKSILLNLFGLSGIAQMKTMIQMIFLFAVVLVATELFWAGSSPQQRKAWLKSIPVPGLDKGVETERNQPVIPQLLSLLRNPPTTVVTRSEDTKRVPIQANEPGYAAIKDTLNSVINGIVHLNHVRPVCIKPPTQEINDVDDQSVYRWTDASGRVHFGDKARQHNAQDMSKVYSRRTQGVKLTIEYPNWSGDSRLDADLHKEAALMYRIVTQYIPRSEWRQINLNLVIFPHQAAFEVYKRQQRANRGWMAYYDGRANQAYMARQDNHTMTMRLARHEMTHAMMLGMLGSTPIWISEGMAQYLERLEWQMSSAQVAPDQYTYAQLNADDDHFIRVAGMNHDTFNGKGQQDNYNRSSAMMHFLLGHREGQKWVKDILGYFAMNPCGNYDAEYFFNQSYPKGLDGVMNKYQHWLKQQEYRTHYY